MKNESQNPGRILPDDEAAEYTEVYKKGSDLLSRHMDLHDRKPTLSGTREAELREGIRLLQRAVAILPTSWPAHWLIGKGYQALGDHERAYGAFRQAARVNQDNPDVPRELCLECLRLGKYAEAVEE
jgi:tetratricopeptide (TPR) repeat protein